ncbi:hypothetical protein [Enterococcus diestrammenae]|uniref:Uncharacterized protein n=1 Tax=Enterococcus diestrammenae TaxID=1155073 RepID=A0ABV0EYV3_9ENTE|nr:hypothetical protein [Enterococcus diestrammenae]KAF1294794.1 hypothetical protein BAU18_03575 [Enterococcus diestrammenae]
MKDFNEAVLIINVKPDSSGAYKVAIEAENSPRGLLTHWNGIHGYVDIDKSKKHQHKLIIQLVSHTLPNLKQAVEWYVRVGCTLVRTDYKEEAK